MTFFFHVWTSFVQRFCAKCHRNKFAQKDNVCAAADCSTDVTDKDAKCEECGYTEEPMDTTRPMSPTKTPDNALKIAVNFIRKYGSEFQTILTDPAGDDGEIEKSPEEVEPDDEFYEIEIFAKEANKSLFHVTTEDQIRPKHCPEYVEVRDLLNSIPALVEQVEHLERSRDCLRDAAARWETRAETLQSENSKLGMCLTTILQEIESRKSESWNLDVYKMLKQILELGREALKTSAQPQTLGEANIRNELQKFSEDAAGGE